MSKGALKEMGGFVEKMFACVRSAAHGWHRCKLVGVGVLYLLIAVTLGISAVPNEEDVSATQMDFLSLPNYDYIGEVVKLKETNKEEAKRLAQYIFETEGMPNRDEARRIFDEIEKEQKNWWNRTKRAAKGAALGEGDSIEELGGSVLSDMFLYGDVRDLIKHTYFKVTKNEKGDSFIITLSLFGLATEFVDVVDWAPAVLKAFRKAGALSAKMVDLLSGGMKKCMQAKKIDRELLSLFSEIKTMTDSLGFARASSVMRHADNAADVATLAKAAKVAPNETYLLVKYSDKTGVRTLENLSEGQLKILREVAKKGPDALKNAKKYMNWVKSKTSSARRFARFIKSIQSGHLTGLLHKLVLRFPFLSFVIIAISLLCIALSGLKFWAALNYTRPSMTKDRD